MLSRIEHEKSFITSGPVLQQELFVLLGCVLFIYSILEKKEFQVIFKLTDSSWLRIVFQQTVLLNWELFFNEITASHIEFQALMSNVT